MNRVQHFSFYLQVALNRNHLFGNEVGQDFVVLAELRRHLLNRSLEVLLVHLLGQLWVTVPVLNRKGLGTLYDALQLSPSIVGRRPRKFLKVDLGAKHVVLPHLKSVDVQNFLSSLLVRQTHLDVHFQPPWSQYRLIDQVLPVGYSYHQDIIETLNLIDTGQKLVNDEIVHPVAAD